MNIYNRYQNVKKEIEAKKDSVKELEKEMILIESDISSKRFSEHDLYNLALGIMNNKLNLDKRLDIIENMANDSVKEFMEKLFELK